MWCSRRFVVLDALIRMLNITVDYTTSKVMEADLRFVLGILLRASTLKKIETLY